jgi:putative peptide zinc metalloprotease protein
MTDTRITPRDEVESPADWFLHASPELRHDVEHLEGLDDRPLLFLPSSGKYLAVSPTAGRIAERFTGETTGSSILLSMGIQPDHPTATRIAAMALELRQAGFLTERRADESLADRTSHFALREHLIRFPLVRNVDPLLEPIARLLRRVPAVKLTWIWVVLAILGMITGAAALAQVRVDAVPAHLWVLLPIIALQIAIHETAHAVVCQYLRVPVREAGMGLMFYFMPVGYVDRTDAYRVRSRSGRVMIAMAGPLSDQLWFGAAGIVALTAPPEVAGIAVVLMIFQILLTIMNFNPLAPSDGYHAASAMAGLVNLRGNSLALLVHTVTRAPLPNHLQNLGSRDRRAMFAYGLACLAFALLLAVLMIRSALQLIGA